ncbi:hypothetical protein C8R46DRAFT_1247011 [Mycena filopes]|nr:hypothetical protein C8R46DRAFT_1247011 [Mycena filopes]
MNTERLGRQADPHYCGGCDNVGGVQDMTLVHRRSSQRYSGSEQSENRANGIGGRVRGTRQIYKGHHCCYFAPSRSSWDRPSAIRGQRQNAASRGSNIRVKSDGCTSEVVARWKAANSDWISAQPRHSHLGFFRPPLSSLSSFCLLLGLRTQIQGKKMVPTPAQHDIWRRLSQQYCSKVGDLGGHGVSSTAGKNTSPRQVGAAVMRRLTRRTKFMNRRSQRSGGLAGLWFANENLSAIPDIENSRIDEHLVETVQYAADAACLCNDAAVTIVDAARTTFNAALARVDAAGPAAPPKTLRSTFNLENVVASHCRGKGILPQQYRCRMQRQCLRHSAAVQPAAHVELVFNRHSAALCGNQTAAIGGTCQRQNWQFAAAIVLHAAAVVLSTCGTFAVACGNLVCDMRHCDHTAASRCGTSSGTNSTFKSSAELPTAYLMLPDPPPLCRHRFRSPLVQSFDTSLTLKFQLQDCLTVDLADVGRFEPAFLHRCQLRQSTAGNQPQQHAQLCGKVPLAAAALFSPRFLKLLVITALDVVPAFQQKWDTLISTPAQAIHGLIFQHKTPAPTGGFAKESGERVWALCGTLPAATQPPCGKVPTAAAAVFFGDGFETTANND